MILLSNASAPDRNYFSQSFQLSFLIHLRIFLPNLMIATSPLWARANKAIIIGFLVGLLLDVMLLVPLWFPVFGGIFIILLVPVWVYGYYLSDFHPAEILVLLYYPLLCTFLFWLWCSKNRAKIIAGIIILIFSLFLLSIFSAGVPEFR